MKVGTKQIEGVTYSPAISPRYSSAAAIVGDELYLLAVVEIDRESKSLMLIFTMNYVLLI